MPETSNSEGKKCEGKKCEGKPTPATPPAADGDKKPLKPCCACPETKQVRDKCIMEFGEEHCGKLIEAHKECMRSLGFKI